LDHFRPAMLVRVTRAGRSRPLGSPRARPRMTHTQLRHHVVVRVTHWVNALALAIMIGSGLRIFNSYPAFARKGETFCCYPFEGHKIPVWLTFGGWLGGARHGTSPRCGCWWRTAWSTWDSSTCTASGGIWFPVAALCATPGRWSGSIWRFARSTRARASTTLCSACM